MHCSASDPAFNDNSQNENLLKAIIYAGTARLVKVKLPKAVFDKGIGGAIERERESREVKFFEKEEGESIDLAAFTSCLKLNANLELVE